MRHDELGLVRLKRRADFLRVARTGRRHAAPGLVLQVADGRAESGRAGKGVEASVDASVGIGFTASKKVGNAVARNRVKRRLRAAVTEVMPKHAAPGRDYVLIGRPNVTASRPYTQLAQDFQTALARLHTPRPPSQDHT